MKIANLLPSIIAIAGRAAFAAAPSLQVIIAHHPLVATVVATIYAVMCHLAPQPNQ